MFPATETRLARLIAVSFPHKHFSREQRHLIGGSFARFLTEFLRLTKKSEPPSVLEFLLEHERQIYRLRVYTAPNIERRLYRQATVRDSKLAVFYDTILQKHDIRNDPAQLLQSFCVLLCPRVIIPTEHIVMDRHGQLIKFEFVRPPVLQRLFLWLLKMLAQQKGAST